MDEASMNRYEKQLYTVFKTFDVGNEEALDISAVHELCDALQLEDRGAALVDTLFERSSDRVTFTQFRNGLLAVLGASGPSDASDQPPAAGPAPDPPHSDDDSSGREVAPKFVFGSKKYGRRSRPPRLADEPGPPRSSSASRLDTDDKKAKQRMRCKRSASAMESRDESADPAPGDAFEHDRRIDREQAVALCRSLNMDGIDRRLVERIFEDSGAADTTVGEFFDRLNTSLTTRMEEAARASPGADDDVPGDLVLQAWERAGVQQPRRLLAELGFGAPALRPAELERALDDELRALAEPADESRSARALLLGAALALARLRLELARRRADHHSAERDKLRADVAEADRRARLLAQEVDEGHSRVEAEAKASLRRAEARHAEATRLAAAESAAERERAAAALARLEAEVARRAEAEARARADADALRERVEALEARVAQAEERAGEAERERARLAGELRAERGRAEGARGAAPAREAPALEALRRENAALRDRNDELCAELEARARGAAAAAAPLPGDLAVELNSFLPYERSDESDSSPVSIDRRILGPEEAALKLREIFETVDVQSGEDECRSCASGEALRRVRELSDAAPPAPPSPPATAHRLVQTDDDDALRRTLLDAEQKHEDEKRKLTALIKELEASLEQMRAEYDKCEEYWSGKLEEERELFAEEQRLGDERLGELADKIGEYERQFASAPLPTIDERTSLEAQFTDLEEEFAAYRRDKDAALAARDAELRRLAERVASLERAPPRAPPRPAPPRAPPAADECRELRARTARAEAAARRLHARLAAADVLVKDLYVENCQLSHRRL